MVDDVHHGARVPREVHGEGVGPFQDQVPGHGHLLHEYRVPVPGRVADLHAVQPDHGVVVRVGGAGAAALHGNPHHGFLQARNGDVTMGTRDSWILVKNGELKIYVMDGRSQTYVVMDEKTAERIGQQVDSAQQQMNAMME